MKGFLYIEISLAALLRQNSKTNMTKNRDISKELWYDIFAISPTPTVKAQKSMKGIVGIEWFNLNLMKWQEYFLYTKKIKIMNDFIQQLSAILESIHWTQTAYAVQPHHTDTLFSFKSKHK